MSTRDLARKFWPVVLLLVVLGGWAVARYCPPFGKLVCEFESAPGDPHADYVYTSSFHFWKVQKMEIEQTITSERKDVLEPFIEAAETAQKESQNKKNYTINVESNSKMLVSTTTINYKNMSSDELSDITGSNSRKKALFVGSVKKTYQKIGASCKYK